MARNTFRLWVHGDGEKRLKRFCGPTQRQKMRRVVLFMRTVRSPQCHYKFLMAPSVWNGLLANLSTLRLVIGLDHYPGLSEIAGRSTRCGWPNTWTACAELSLPQHAWWWTLLATRTPRTSRSRSSRGAAALKRYPKLTSPSAARSCVILRIMMDIVVVVGTTCVYRRIW